MWVFLRFGFSDSVMEKIAFNDPYRFVPAIFRGAETFLKKEAGLTVRLGVLVTQKNYASPERRRNAEIVVRR